MSLRVLCDICNKELKQQSSSFGIYKYGDEEFAIKIGYRCDEHYNIDDLHGAYFKHRTKFYAASDLCADCVSLILKKGVRTSFR